MNLREVIKKARSEGTAIGHFNASTLDGIWAIADAAHTLGLPVIVGFSEGERDYVGVKQAVSIIRSIREDRGQPIFLNADHTYSVNRTQEAIDAGFDAVIFDGAELSLEDNIAQTKSCVSYAKSSGLDVLVEGELGFIGKSSKILDEIPEKVARSMANLTSPEDAKRFVSETGVDLFAPAVGNIHGMVKTGEPRLDIQRVADISNIAGVPLVLHGASGNSEDDIRKSIKAGISIVHVNTELRVAYRASLVKSLTEDREELSPYKYLKSAKLAMQDVVEQKLRIFSGK